MSRSRLPARDRPFKLIDVLRKGRKAGYVIASALAAR
jgi:hypothetical protein